MTPTEKLAQSLEELQKLQKKAIVAIRSRDLTRTHRSRLIKNGFLKEVLKGWYIICRPDELPGDSTSWYVSFWNFCASYLNKRFDQAWCLSPEQSLAIHADNWTVPKQLLVRSKKASNTITQLPFHTSLLDVRCTTMPQETDIEEKNGLRLFAKVPGLIACSPSYFIQHPIDARILLASIQDASEILPALLEGGHSTIAGRLVGAFKNIGNDRIANAIQKTMRAAGYDIREQNPFESEIALFPYLNDKVLPGVNRMRILWQAMRQTILERFPKPPDISMNVREYLQTIEEQYMTDAYHSLSIEGYQVSAELIDRVRRGGWDPDHEVLDKNDKNALAARGYWQAFQSVKHSIQKVLMGENAATVAWNDHGDWFRELFAPSVSAHLLKPLELAGYRRHPVYIRCSMHVPPHFSTVPELMQAFFDLLAEEREASVRIVLGHFFFVFIHPYRDGNGRIGRFLMNLMCAAGQYPWMIVPVEYRQTYMNALEEASVKHTIIPFCDFLGALLEHPSG